MLTAKDADAVAERAEAAALPLTRIGATGGRVLAVGEEKPLPIKNLTERFESWLPAYMARPA